MVLIHELYEIKFSCDKNFHFQMFSPIQKQAVALYLKSLETQRDVLTHALGTINEAIEECKICLTIKDVQTRNFLEMMQYLEEINKENLQKYSAILIDNNYIVENQYEINNSSINERNLPNQPQRDVTADSDRFVSIEQFNLLQKKLDMATDLIDLKCQELRTDVNTIKGKVENLESHNNTVMQYNSKVEQTENNLQALTEQINKQNILTTMLSENMERKVNSFNDLIDSFNDKMKQMNNAIHDLNDSSNDSKKQIEILWNKLKNSHVQLNDTESSLRNLSEEQLRISLYFKTFEDKYKNLEVKCGTICQLLAKKFKIFESLKEVLTKPSLTKGDTFIKLNPNANALASTMPDYPVAVCVTIKNNLAISPGDIIKAFENVICNVDDHFDVNKGEFTVPTSGIYFISLTLSLEKRVFDSVRIAVSCVSAHNKSADVTTDGSEIVEDNAIACVDCFQSESAATDVSVIYLEAGEKLFLQVLKAHKSVRLSDFSSFTCYKI
ncbi:uncharacterized protein LOC131948842 [Physella acuta]|uniref:uncharacterized protein LOC131948842 n=1 Tax=Physella acuta TaxID=109671 RepID=UPI0027DD230B|nr:uncharacterized protein LOC131948842 [Physella acuta]